MSRMLHLVYCVILFQFSIFGQNLIPNPDFEEIDGCPIYISLVYADTNPSILDWYTATMGTPDHFNTCSEGGFFDDVGIPHNMFTDFQPTHSGEGYLGVVIDYEYGNYREYIQSQLLSPLIAGEYYYFEGWFAPGTQIIKGGISSYYMKTTDDIGVYFSADRVTDFLEYDTLGVDAHISNETGNLILPPGQWKKVSGFYLAEGGEKWITIGNFKPTAATDKYDIPGYAFDDDLSTEVYFFIDDLSLVHAEDKFLNDTMICEDGSLIWNINLGEGDYLWNTGDTLRSITITTPGTYWLQYSDSLHSYIDSAIVTFHTDSTFFSSTTLSLCHDELPYVLSCEEKYETQQWNIGHFTKSINITGPGTYYVTGRYLCNTYVDTFHIVILPPPADSLLYFNFTNKIMCEENWEYEINGPPGFENYLWSNGDTASSIIVNEPGTYSLHYSIPCYDFFDYITLSEDPYKNYQLDIGDNIDLCATPDHIVVLDAGSLPNYLWNTGATTEEILVSSPGTYYVTTETSCYILSDTVVVTDCLLMTDNLVLYPIPSLGAVTISAENELFLPNTTLEIFSMQGKIWETHFDFHNAVHFDFTMYAKGVYLIRMISGEKVYWFDLVLE